MSGGGGAGGGLPPGFPPGMMGGMMPGMNMDMLQQFLQDPNIRRMTEAISTDPTFQEMAREMQASMLSGGMGGLNLAGGAEGGARAAGGAGAGAPLAGADPAKYMEAMQRVMGNPDFVKAAESLGRSLMSQALDPETARVMELFSDPANADALKSKLESLKSDPELADVMADIEANGQAAMMKWMADPEVMAKMGRKFQAALDDPELRARLAPAAGGGGGGGEAAAADGEGDGEPAEPEGLLGAAAAGDAAALAALLAAPGADADERDAEGRTALHLAAGYGEMACVEALLAGGGARARVDARDANGNTPLHYAAGYGLAEAAARLVAAGADKGAKNDEGRTPGEVAEMNGQDEVAAALKAA